MSLLDMLLGSFECWRKRRGGRWVLHRYMVQDGGGGYWERVG